MVNPIELTNYNRNDFELEETILFSILVTGKNALVTARNMDRFLYWNGWVQGDSPFNCLKNRSIYHLTQLLKQNGIGCYNIKGRGVHELANGNLNLKTCNTEDLEKIYGIGLKTSRMFLLHTRKDVRVAVLDTHILKFLGSKGHNVPKSTPTSKKKYLELEKLFLKYADESGKTVAEFDLYLWNLYRSKRAS